MYNRNQNKARLLFFFAVPYISNNPEHMRKCACHYTLKGFRADIRTTMTGDLLPS